MWGRVRQVLYYLAPRLTPEAREWAIARLNPAQAALFTAMGRQDQAHAVRVAKRLAEQDAPAWVIEAALLHDCAKPADYTLFWRVAGVLLAPALGSVPESPPARGLMRPLQIYRWHDRYGLKLAQDAGTSPEALELLAAYLEGERHAGPWLTALQQADDLG